MKNFNKSFILKTILIVSSVFLLATCASSKVEKEVSIQQLIMEGRYEEAKELFKTKTDINAVDEDGNTALHIAAKVNEADLISFLIIKGANTEIRNNMDDTPLHVAVKNDNLEAAKVLAIVHGNIFAKDNNIAEL